MKFLIFGGNGFLGSFLYRHLKKNYYKIFNYSIETKKNRNSKVGEFLESAL